LVIDFQKVEKTKPIIYVPRELPSCRLIDVLYEVKNDIAIFWHHWPYDGLPDKEDYEPVILAYRNNVLYGVGIRPHEKLVKSYDWSMEDNRIVIVFTTPWHGPIIYNEKDHLTKIAMKISSRIENYQISPGTPPNWYIKDGTKISIYDYGFSI